MKLGILGVGHIGKTLALKLAAAGHDVKVANSRGPETIDASALATGARAVTTARAVDGVEVVILSIPLNRVPYVAPLLAWLPADTVVMDASNYYPQRDGTIDAIEAGQVESLWVAGAVGPADRQGVELDLRGLVREEGQAAGQPGSRRAPRCGRSRVGSDTMSA